MNKLKSLPKINCITIPSALDRHKTITEEFNRYNLSYELHMGYDKNTETFETLNISSGQFLDQLSLGMLCCSLSHLKAIKNWYYNSEDEYGVFCEDDLSLDLVEYWDFTWDDIINNLPQNWGCIQLSSIRSEFNENYTKFHKYKWDNWGTQIYIISKIYAKKLIDQHILSNNSYYLHLPYFPNTIPIAENILYNIDNKETVYSWFLLNEDIKAESIINNGGSHHLNWVLPFIEWWKTEGKEKDLKWFFKN
jgi:GR25 family glycosyltransferase involved in LPS biosynthesis